MNQELDANRRRFNLAWLLGGSFGGLLAVALVAVLSIQFFAMREATLSLFRDKGDLLIELISGRVREQMDPASAQLGFLAEILGESGADHDDARVSELLTGALAAAPNVAGVIFARANGQAILINRIDAGVEVLGFRADDESPIRRAIEEGRTRDVGWWGELVFSPRFEGPGVNRRHPVWQDGEYLGVLGAVVTLRKLSAIVEGSGADAHGGTAFVLRGREHVLAHKRLLRPFPGLDPGRPLPELDDVDDPILAAIWSGPPAATLLGRTTNSHAVSTAVGPHLFLHTNVPEFGDPAWIVGAYFPLAAIASPVRTMFLAATAAAALLLIALVLALFLARRLARPVREIAAAAAAIADLDFSKAKPLPRSRVTELDDEVVAFNRLLGALRWFEAYVPRNLVRRLAREAPPDSEERILTVMFTDLAGFTTLSQDMKPAEVAELLNAHFARIIAEVEKSGGTVDKFMGDGTMAFWGAPDRLKGHARRALACAEALEGSVAGTGLRLRVGIHTGRVVVGNVGSAERMNYTIVGDAVNATQRIEQLGKEVMAAEDRSCILASEDTWEDADRPAGWVRVGEFTLRGRASPVAVYRHAPDRADAP